MGSQAAIEGPPPSAPKTHPQNKRKQREFDEDDVIDALVDPVRRVNVPPPEGSELSEGEPAGEASSPQHVCPIDPKAKSRERKRLASHQAMQAIWSSNYLLLTNHPDVLPASDLAVVFRCLLEELASEEPAPVSPRDLVLWLIQGMTGRTSKTLPAVRQVERHSPNMKAGDCELCLQTGTLRMGIFWKRPKDKSDPDPAAYFTPSDEQQLLLEPTVDNIDLPLPSRIKEALQRHRRHLAGLGSMQPDAIDAGLRSAARHVSEKIGLHEAVGEGFRQSRREPRAFFVWTAIWFGTFSLAAWTVATSRHVALAGPTPANLPASPRRSVPVLSPSTPPFRAAVDGDLRAVLKPGDRRGYFLRLGMDELRLGGLTLGAFFAAISFGGAPAYLVFLRRRLSYMRFPRRPGSLSGSACS